jgi:streptogramin lyase
MKYFAFVSYAHKDGAAASALSRYIETFRVPVRLGPDNDQLPKRMFPVFRDRDELSASADLGAAIRDALAYSGALIVLCSPAAAQSTWVNEEIRTFLKTGDRERVFLALFEGEPNEALPPALADNSIAPPIIDFRPNAETARDAPLRIVAALLGIDFETLKRRERSRLRNARIRLAVLASVSALAIVAGIIGYNADQSRITEFQIARASSDGALDSITTGPDDALWFTEGDKIGRLAVGGQISEYAVPSGSDAGDITAGSDGALWFTASTPSDAAEIGRVTVNGRFTEYPLHADVNVSGITMGPGGDLWFVLSTVPEGNQDFLVRMSTSGHIYGYYPFSKDVRILGMAIGPGGALWLALWFPDSHSLQDTRIWRTQITTQGRIIPKEYVTTARTHCIALDADGALWFTYTPSGTDAFVGRVSQGGKLTKYPLPPIPGDGLADAYIAAGRDGAMWFAEPWKNAVARITTSGKITEYPIPTSNDALGAITSGPDGALWFVESTSNRIARITVGHWFFGK